MDMFGNEFSFIVYNKNRTMFDNGVFLIEKYSFETHYGSYGNSTRE